MKPKNPSWSQIQDRATRRKLLDAERQLEEIKAKPEILSNRSILAVEE